MSVTLSFAIAFVYAAVVYSLDRYEKEPKRLLIGVFLWGAIVAMSGAILSEVVLEMGVLALTNSKSLASAMDVSVFAPIIEESLKGFAVLLVFLLFRSEFDSILDGIVYAGITALGFAAVENALYAYGMGYLENGLQGMYTILFVRGILGGWNHPMFTAFTGIGLAMARLTTSGARKLFAPILGWCAAVALHMMHNSFIQFFGGAGFIVVQLIDWVGWLLVFVILVWAIRREKHWITQNLRDEVQQGTLTAAQYQTACSSTAQYGARVNALMHGHYRLTNRFYRATAELAFKKQQLKFDDAAIDNGIIAGLRAEIAHLSEAAQGRGS